MKTNTITNQSALQQSATNQNAINQSAPKQNAINQSAPKQSTLELKPMKTNTTKTSAAKESAAKESAAKESAAKESAAIPDEKTSAAIPDGKTNAAKESAAKESAATPDTAKADVMNPATSNTATTHTTTRPTTSKPATLSPDTFKTKIVNHGYIRDAEVEFHPGINVLRGKSAQGKSTLLRSIESTLFNTPGEALVTYGESSAECIIEYNKHSVRRQRNNKSKEGKTIYYVDGEKYSKTGIKALDEVQQAMGIKEVSPNKEKIRITFSSAFGTPFLVNESPQTVFDFLTFSSNATSIIDIVRQIKEDLLTQKTELKNKEIEINTIKGMIVRDDKHIEKYDGIDILKKKADSLVSKESNIKEFLSLIQRVNTFESKSKQISNVLDGSDFDCSSLSLFDSCTKLSEQINQIDKIRNELNHIEKQHQTTADAIAAFPEDKENIVEKQKTLDSFQKAVKRLSELSLKGKTINDLLMYSNAIKFDGIQKNYEFMENMNAVMKTMNEGKRVSSEIQNIEASLKSINQELTSFPACPLCGQSLCENDIKQE